MADQMMKVKAQEAALIMDIRNIKFGSVLVKVRDGLPYRGEVPKEDRDYTEMAKELGFIASNKINIKAS